MERDHAPSWADLSPPLLELILELLPFVDYLRFPAVCSSFRNVHHHHRLRHAASPRYLRQFPWLLLSGHHSDKNLFNPSENRYYRITFPEHRHYLRVSKHGWILSSAGKSFLLANVFTGSQIQIPFPNINYHMIDYVGESGDLSSVPTDPDCVLLCQFTELDSEDDTFYYFYRFRDNMWTRIKHRGSPGGQLPFCGGKFYELFSFSRKLLQTESLINPVQNRIEMDKTAFGILQKPGTVIGSHLLECDGLVLMARSIRQKDGCRFQVFKADLCRNMWVKLDSLGDYVLFLSGLGHSFSLPAAEIQGPGNRIFCKYYCNENKKEMMAEYKYESHQFVNSRFPGPVQLRDKGEWWSYDWILPSL